MSTMVVPGGEREKQWVRVVAKIAAFIRPRLRHHIAPFEAVPEDVCDLLPTARGVGT